MKTALVALVLAAFSVAIMLGAGARPPAGDPKPETPAEETKPVADTTPAYVKLTTSMGDIYLELNREKAPITTANFISYVEKGHYDGTIFHRVIPDFMIQGGDPLGTGRGGPGYTFADEIHPDLVFDEPGKLAMANSGPDTNGSQFFVTTVPTPWLDGKHTIFGEVADSASLDVAVQISQVPTDGADRPVEDVVLESVTIHRSGD